MLGRHFFFNMGDESGPFYVSPCGQLLLAKPFKAETVLLSVVVRDESVEFHNLKELLERKFLHVGDFADKFFFCLHNVFIVLFHVSTPFV